jgi:hypothetical protein
MATSIFELPTDTNVKFNITDNIVGENTKLSQMESSLDPSIMNELVSGIQQARSNGATNLQSRDIPINKTQYLDEQVQQEYIPKSNVTHDFIEEEEEEERKSNSIFDYNNTKKYILENNFKECQLAIILSMIYFLFQLPFIRVLLSTYIPMFFFKDGNINIYGNIFMALIFGLIYYILALLMNM